MSSKAPVIFKAEFNPILKKYFIWNGIIICLFSIVLIPLVPIWVLFSSFYINKYLERLHCELTTRSLRFQKGYLFHTERTIPLDKIQDLTFKEGPLLKYFGLSILSIETAGSSGQNSADLSLFGIVDATSFRNKVLDQRDKVTDNEPNSTSKASESESVVEILKEIRSSLKVLEDSALANRADGK